MEKVIGVTEMQQRFQAVFDEVVRERIPYVLTHDSRPEAVLIPYKEFLHFQELQEQEILEQFDNLLTRMANQNAAYSDEEVAADVAAARNELPD
jgi:prevent-host-death family protein